MRATPPPARRRAGAVAGLAVAAGGGLALAACGPDDVVVAPVIDGPAAGSDAAAFPDLDELVITLARAGSTADLLSATFTRGQTVELRGAPEGDELVVHLTGRLGGQEVAYGRTCAFALRAGEPPPAPHLWFARTVKWGELDASPAPVRRDGRAVAYRDGSALFVGGHDAAGEPVTAVERFDPRAGALTTVADLAPRRAPVVASLGDGRLLVAGGIDGASDTASDRLEVLELDVTGAGRVDTFVDQRLARAGATAVTLTDGRVVIFGGGAVTGPPLAAPVEIAADGATVAVRDLRAAMAVPRRGATATRLSDDLGAPVLVSGGVDLDGQPVALAELWRPLREDFADPQAFAPAMRVPRHRHAAPRMPDGSVLVIGGLDAAGQPVRALELFTLDGGFVDAGLLPPGAGVVDATVTALPDGRILVAGGRETADGEPVQGGFIVNLDPLDGSVDAISTDRLERVRAGHAATALCDGTIVVLGGTELASPVERYSPPPLGRR
ncbi:MAG: hypothetical protein KJZ91_30220 [Myxococcales bacterium]|nr:hypothetical protein [Myxococcales bacterium]